jgi:hypothetical protein
MLEPKATAPQPFVFKHFGTFAGPQYLDKSAYSYDATSKEGLWHTLKPIDTSFKKLDLGAYLFNNKADYVGFHCDFVSTAQMTLEASYGNIPVFNVLVAQTNVTGNIRTIGDIHSVGNLTCNGLFTFNGTMNLTGLGNVAAKVNQIDAAKLDKSNKGFDIEHPNKEGYRLRHICVEGPEDGPIYIRGKLEGNLLKLPDYWDGLVDEESISVHLTSIGSFQELFVEKIDWGKNVWVKNASGGPVNCYYQVWAARKFNEKLHVEYEGQSPADYPGDTTRFSIAGYDYDRRA